MQATFLTLLQQLTDQNAAVDFSIDYVTHQPQEVWDSGWQQTVLTADVQQFIQLSVQTGPTFGRNV